MIRPDLAQFGKALSSPVRVHILTLLHGRALCVNALATKLSVTQGAVSQHLRILREAGIVLGEKRGYHVHYRLDERRLVAWREALYKLLTPRQKSCTKVCTP